MKLELCERSSEARSASGIFIVSGTSGNDRGVADLIDSMGNTDYYSTNRLCQQETRARAAFLPAMIL